MSDNKKNKYYFIVFASIVTVIVVIFLNSFVYYGHEVTNISENKDKGNYSVSNIVGYELSKDNNGYILTDYSNHYITIFKDSKSSECLLKFSKINDKDTKVKVWCMNSDGLVLDEYNTTWEKNKRILFVDDIPESASLISFGIDSDFYISEVYFAKTYSKKKVFLFVSSLIVIALIAMMILLYKKNKMVFINSLFDRITKGVNIKRLIRLMVIVFFDGILSFVMVAFINKLGICINSNPIAINYKTVSIVFALLFTISFLILCKEKVTQNIALYGALFVFLVGSLYSFLEPASNGVCLDDENHYNRTAGLSHIVDNRRPLADQMLFNNYISVIDDKVTYDSVSSKEYNNLYDEIDAEGFFYNDVNYKFNYQRLVYIPLAIGLCFARGIGLPYHMQIMVGRWFNIIFLAIIAFFAIKRINYGKMIVLLVILIPTNIFFASGYSYDIWLTGWALLAFSYLFYEMQSNDFIEKKSIIIISISFALSMIVKQVYFLLIIPALFLTNRKFKNVKQNVKYRFIMLFLILLPFVLALVNQLINAGEGDLRGGTGVNASGQVDYFLNNSFQVFKIIVIFLKQYLNPLDGGKYYLNYIGYNGLIKGSEVTLLVILLYSFICHEQKKGTFPAWFRIGMGLLYIAVGGICAFSLYIIYTPVGAGYVSGCQARYMLPTIFPVLYVLTRIPSKTIIKDKIGENLINSIIIVSIVCINLYCLTKGCVLLY